MAAFGPTDDLRGAEFVDTDLREARFDRALLTGAVLRGVEVDGMEIDSPWLDEDGATLLVNGVDVAGYVDAELDRRFPGRAQRTAQDPDGLRAAWDAVQRTWTATLARAAALPTGAVDVSVRGEWSFAQTLRHLVMATDVWLRQTIQGEPNPFHPLGLPFAEYESEGYDMTPFATTRPSYDEVLAARADRVDEVGRFLAGLTPDRLAEEHPHPWGPDRRVTTLHCLHTILHEEWEHHRFAVRDLDALAAQD